MIGMTIVDYCCCYHCHHDFDEDPLEQSRTTRKILQFLFSKRDCQKVCSAQVDGNAKDDGMKNARLPPRGFIGDPFKPEKSEHKK